MKSFLNRKLALGASALALFGGAAAAVAATQGSAGAGHQAYVEDVAKRLGVSPTALTAAMRAAHLDRVAAALAAGHISKTKAALLKRRIQGAGHASLSHRSGLGPARIAAQYLGIDRHTLRSELRSGRSLAQIAASTPGRSVEGLKAALRAAARTRLASAVSGGAITSQQEQKRLTTLSRKIDALLQRSRVARAGGGGTSRARRH
jgi:hypothetical protein